MSSIELILKKRSNKIKERIQDKYYTIEQQNMIKNQKTDQEPGCKAWLF